MTTDTTFTLHIDCSNAAFDGDPTVELARLLRETADRLEAGDYWHGHSRTIFDINGNDVGRYRIGDAS